MDKYMYIYILMTKNERNQSSCYHYDMCSLPLFLQELNLPDVPVMMTLLDERPSGKLCVSYQKQTVVDAVDEIKATTQRIPNLDIAKVGVASGCGQWVRLGLWTAEVVGLYSL